MAILKGIRMIYNRNTAISDNDNDKGIPLSATKMIKAVMIVIMILILK